MVIDTHTHIFPDKMASATVKALAEKANIIPSLDARATSLLDSMEKSGVDKSVLLPALTAPRQFDSVNRYTLETSAASGGHFIPFGGIHPDCENVSEKIKFLADSGFYGIKLHPDYQNTYADDEKYINIVTLAVKNGLAVTFHAGVDIGIPDDVKCTPERAYRMLEKVLQNTVGYECKIILAHMGGFSMAEKVLQLLCGAPVYFDTAYSLDDANFDASMEIIKKHGADKILFATDSPWASQTEYLEKIRQSDLSENDLNKILSKNAKKLLGI